jgi:hypothetical protein
MKPYQFRLFIPFVYKVVSIFSFVPPKALYMMINCLIVYLTIVVYYYFISEYFRHTVLNFFLAPVIVYPMVWNYVLLSQTFQYYDLCAVFFFVLGLYLIVKGRFSFLLIVFVLALLNKESSVYLIFAYLLYNYKSIFKIRTIANTLIMAAIFVGIKLFLSHIFRNNSGDDFEVTVYGNLETVQNFFQSHVYAKSIFLNFGGIYLFTVLLFITGRWRKFNHLERLPLIFINLVFVPYILFGIFLVYYIEVRVYAELIPVFTTLFLVYLSTDGKIPMTNESH